MPGNGAVGASYGDLLVTSLLVLGGVCVAAFVVVRVVGRVLATGRSRGVHVLDVVARLPLEPRRSLYVIEVAGKTLLVGTSEMGLSLLSELDGGEVRARVVGRASFGELVRAAWLRRRGPSESTGAGPAEVAVDGAGDTAAGHPAVPATRQMPDAIAGDRGAAGASGANARRARGSVADHRVVTQPEARSPSEPVPEAGQRLDEVR